VALPSDEGSVSFSTGRGGRIRPWGTCTVEDGMTPGSEEELVGSTQIG